MKRREFLKLIGAETASLMFLKGCGNFSRTQAFKRDGPNLIFILADDLGYGDLGCYGQKIIKTSNIDRMAAEGMKFTQHYAGSTVCAPSRCSLMTGLNTGHCRIRDNTPGASLLKQDYTVAEMFKEAGYKTAVIGKWGLGGKADGLPNQKGFDYFFGYLNQVHAHNYYPEFLWRNKKKVFLRNIVQRPVRSKNPEVLEYGGAATERLDYSNDLFTQEIINYIENNYNSSFFLYAAYTLPHANGEAPGVLGRHGMEVPNEGIYAKRKWPDAQKCHAAMISKLDNYVGKIFDVLKKTNIDDNTLVIFTSDSGFFDTI
ncbi:MAG TPA: N-acetylgalactosamine-6-sulfatase, partial [Phycisphaerales bacterium]|nr:N-acetylgalactosamine-6-sulfatase [Phycisphaerales bacterium]